MNKEQSTSSELKYNTGKLPTCSSAVQTKASACSLTFKIQLRITFTENKEVNSETGVHILYSPLVEIMNDRAGWGVELPLHQPVLRSQLQYFVGIKDVLERRPAVVLVRLEDHRQFKGRGDTWVYVDAPHRLQALFALHVDLDGGTTQPAGLISRGAHHVLAHSGGHLARQQQHLAVQGGGFGLCQTALDLPGHILLQEPLPMLQTCVSVGICGKRAGVLLG